MSEFDAAEAAVQAALDAGATYADARVMHRRYESMTARNGDVEDVGQDEDAGIGVRALVGSGWGFYAVPDLDDASARLAGSRATAIAASSAPVSRARHAAAGRRGARRVVGQRVPHRPARRLAGDEGRHARCGPRRRWSSTAPTSPRRCTRSGTPPSGSCRARAHRIDQRVRECGAGIMATSIGDGETQRRSYPAARGQYGTRGWEMVDEIDIEAHAARVAEESRALLSAPPCPSGETTLILGGEQMALQIHESVGHAIELDRILGWEAAYAGTSWLDLAQLGALQYGSELMNITIDPTIPGALGSFGYDDEGTAGRAARCRARRHVGRRARRPGLGRRRRARLRRQRARPTGWARLPMVRMTNVGLEPGPHTLEEIIAATDDGIYMETNRSWSIDDKRLNFQFGTEVGYEVKDGQLGRLLRNPTYTGHRAAVLALARHAVVGDRGVGDAELRQGPAGPDRPHRPPGGARPLPQRPGRGAGVSASSISRSGCWSGCWRRRRAPTSRSASTARRRR